MPSPRRGDPSRQGIGGDARVDGFGALPECGAEPVGDGGVRGGRHRQCGGGVEKYGVSDRPRSSGEHFVYYPRVGVRVGAPKRSGSGTRYAERARVDDLVAGESLVHGPHLGSRRRTYLVETVVASDDHSAGAASAEDLDEDR